MTEQNDQIQEAETETADSLGQGEKQTTEVESLSGSEAQTNTEEEAEGREEKMIPIPSKKWRETNQTIRALKEEIESLRTNTAEIESSSSEDYQDDSQVAIDNIANAVVAKISPSLSYFKKLEREKAIEDIGNRPYAKELSKEIAKNFVSDAFSNFPEQERMEKAYQMAVGANIDKLGKTIVNRAKDEGYNSAYEKIAEKQSAETLKSGAKTAQSEELTLDDIGKMNPKEYEKRREDVFQRLGLGKPGR